jgi:hypothetical protein
MLETLVIYTFSVFLQANDLIQMCQVCKRLCAVYFETMVKTKVWALAELPDSVPREWILRLKCNAKNYCYGLLDCFPRLQHLYVNWPSDLISIWLNFEDLPQSLLCITLGNNAHFQFANWPPNLTRLEVGHHSSFLEVFGDESPLTLTDAKFGDFCIYPALPDMPSLTNLEIGAGYCDLSCFQCRNLTTLKLDKNFKGIPDHWKSKLIPYETTSQKTP